MARFRQMTIRKNACSESIPIDLTGKLGIIFNQPAAFRHRAHEITFTLYECIKALPRYDELIPTSTPPRRLVPRFCKRSDLLSNGLVLTLGIRKIELEAAVLLRRICIRFRPTGLNICCCRWL